MSDTKQTKDLPLRELTLQARYVLALDWLKEKLGYSDDKLASVVGVSRATLAKQRYVGNIKLTHYNALQAHMRLLASAETYVRILDE